MNKKVLSAILFSALFAGTGTFTSCIDNDEPAGIEELRGAKAELIRAKVAVEAANAQSILANAALTQAKAETEKAVAAYQKALADQQAEIVKQEALRTALQAATNEAEKARLQAEIAESATRKAAAEAEMEKAAKQHEVNMQNLETSLLEAQAAYETAMKNLKLAQVVLTDEQQAAVQALIEQIDAVKEIANTAEQNLFDAQQKLAQALYEQEAGNDVAEAEFDVKVAEHELADAKAQAAKVAEYAAKDLASTEWEKEAVELKAEIDAANLELKELQIEREKLAAANKVQFDTLMMALDAVTKSLNNDGEGYPVSKYENKTIAENEAAKDLIPAMAGYSAGVFSYGADEETFSITVDADGEVTNKGIAGGYLTLVENWIEKLEEVTVDPNTTAANQLLLAGKQEKVEDALEDYEEAVAEWTIAMDAYVNGEFVAVPTADYQAVVTAYNANVEALAAAITAYNAKYAELYAAGAQAGKDAYLLIEKHAKFTTASKAKLAGAPYNIVDAADRIDAINLLAGSNLASAISQIEALYAAPSTVTEATEKAKYTAGLTAVKAQLDIDMQQYALDHAEMVAAKEVEGGKKAINDAINTDGKYTKALTVAKKAITDAAAKLTAAENKAGSYLALQKAIADYADLVEVPYAQALTEDAEAATAAMTANATFAAKTAGVVADYAKEYEIKTSTVTEEEFADATETEELEGNALKAVWEEASENAFGYNDRVIALTDFTNLKEGDTTSAVAKLVAAQQDLKLVEDKIAVGETMTALVAELTAQKAVLEAEIAVATDAYAAAKVAYAEKETAYNAIFAEIDEEVVAIEHAIATAERVMNTLNGVITAYIDGLDYSFTYFDEDGNIQTVNFEYVEGVDNSANLKHFFEEWALAEESNVLKAEGELKAAKAFLAMIEAGEYSPVAMETRLVEKAQAAYDEAKAILDNLYAKLEALLDSFDAE